MITFFRRVREKLIGDGNIRRYLVYAIGEIALVMIGILLALQVNNWNTIRLERAEEKQILINLDAEFNKAIEQLEYLNDLRKDWFSASYRITEISNDDLKYDEKELDSLVVMTMYNPTFNDPIGSLNTLFISGKINLISSNDLKTKLISWPSESLDMMEDEIAQLRFQDEEYRPLIQSYLSMANVFNFFEISDITLNKNVVEMKGLAPSKRIKSDYEGMLQDPLYLNALHTRAVFMNISFNETEILIRKAREIVALINSEIEGL